MEKLIIEMKYGEIIIIDPCYIDNVIDSGGHIRFDALKCVKTLKTDGDGYYVVNVGNEKINITVDSGRIWCMEAEFDTRVMVDSGTEYHILPPDYSLENVDTEE